MSITGTSPNIRVDGTGGSGGGAEGPWYYGVNAVGTDSGYGGLDHVGTYIVYAGWCHGIPDVEAVGYTYRFFEHGYTYPGFEWTNQSFSIEFTWDGVTPEEDRSYSMTAPIDFDGILVYRIEDVGAGDVAPPPFNYNAGGTS